jgi:hypothetical protein
MEKVVKTEVFGYPKIGVTRELKKVLGRFWSGKIGRDDFF